MRVGLRSVVVGVVAALSAALALAPAASASVNFGADPVPGTPGPNGLPNARAYEEVTPAVKHGAEAGYSSTALEFGRPPLYSVASASGESILFSANGSFGLTASGLSLYDVSRRQANGSWITSAALPPVVEEPNVATDLPYDFLPSANLQQFAYTTEKASVAGANAVSQAGSDQSNSPNLYLTGEGAGITPSYGVEPAWLAKPQTASIEPALGGLPGIANLIVSGASPELSRVYFSYVGTLLGEEDLSRAPHVADAAGGFYEWAEGKLQNAGALPEGGFDAYGAEAAGVAAREIGATPESYNNDVAAAGERAFFVSPSWFKPSSAEACVTAKYSGPGGCVPQIYARIHEGGRTRVVLVSRDELTHGGPAPESPTHLQSTGVGSTRTMMYAAQDGSRVFFADNAALTQAAAEAKKAYEEANPGRTPEPMAYEDDLAANGGEGEVVYRPGLPLGQKRSFIIGASPDGTRVLVMQGLNRPRGIELWERRVEGKEVTEVVTPVAESATASTKVESFRSTADGSAFVFVTSQGLKPYGEGHEFNPDRQYTEVYRYLPGTGELACLSCTEAAPTGNARISNDDAFNDNLRSVNNRAMNAAGTEVFFDTPDALVPQDVNNTRDVYEWQAAGTGGCAHLSGCVYLISSGTSQQESFFLDNGEKGENVFFATTSALSPEDKEGGYDVYDARVGGHAAVLSEEASGCGSECEKPPAGSPSAPSVLSEAAGPTGNLAAPAPASQKAGNAKKSGKRARAKARRRKLARCRKRARRRRNRGRRRHALRRCRRRFGAKAARRHHGGHHAHARRHGHAHGKRRRG